MEFIEQNFDIFAILFGVSFLAIFIAAATNRVTVFKDYGDLWTTLGLILWPSFGLMILAFIQPEESNDIFFGSRAASVITILTAVVTLYSLVKTFTNSIAENGPVIGSVVGVFKVLSSIIIIFSVLGYINRITEDNRSLGSTLIFITIFTFIFKWILDVLVNGHKVKPRLN
tara:strand:- start:280 stop:792 length:513 start_codon:yes stop_codon:yes gene_type:complete